MMKLGKLQQYLKHLPSPMIDEIFEEIEKKANQNLDARGIYPQGTFNPSYDSIKESWKVLPYRDNYKELMNMAPHAEWVEWGTGVYREGGGGIIYPRKEKYMTFQTPEGRWVKVPFIWGQRPKLFFSDAVDEVTKNIIPKLAKKYNVDKMPL